MVVRHGGSQMHSVEAVLVRVQEVAKIKKPLLSFEMSPAKNNGCQLANSSTHFSEVAPFLCC